MIVHSSLPPIAIAMFALAACSRPATQTAVVAPSPTQPVAMPTAAPAPAPSINPPPVPVNTAAAQGPATPAAASANGYSCSFPGPSGGTILARFTLDGVTARDDQGLAFNVLANSPTALVLAHPRDDLATAPAGDVGAYMVAIDRRTLGMVQSTVGLNGPGVTRRGHCIAG